MRDFVIVPQAVYAKYWPLTWPELLAAAEQGTDQLRKVQFKPGDEPLWRPKDDRGEFIPGYEDWDTIALMREGEYPAELGKVFLFKRNW